MRCFSLWLGLLLLSPSLVALGCGDFANDPLAGPPEPAASPVIPVGTPAALEPGVAALTITPNGLTLPDARYGDPYAIQLGAGASSGVCWRVSEGALPPGLRLDQRTGLLGGRVDDLESGLYSFRVTARSPCDGAMEAQGTSETFHLTVHGRCLWDQDCPTGETCREDGICRRELAATCPLPIGPSVRFEPAWARDPSDPLVALYGAMVVYNGFALDDLGCEPADRALVLETATREPRVLCYRLPGELSVPIVPGDIVDLRLLIGRYADRYAMVRTSQTPQGWLWATYSGHADDAYLWKTLCGPHKDCPFLTKKAPVHLNGCAVSGPCETRVAGMRPSNLSKALLPGQQAHWGTASGGEGLYTVLLTDAFVEGRCNFGAVAGGMTYVLLEGARPHPLLRIDKHELLLDTVPKTFEVSGAASISAGLNADESSYVDKFLWALEQPAGNPRPVLLPLSPTLTVTAYLAGEYLIRLGVSDYKTLQQSREQAEARVIVRPHSPLHIELVWEDPAANLDLNLLPPGAAGNWSHEAHDPLSEGVEPKWAKKVEGKKVAQVLAQPEGLPIELVRVDPDSGMIGSFHIAIDQGMGASAPVRASVRIYLHGKRMDDGAFEDILVGPNDFLTLAKVDVANGTFAATWQGPPR